jgi:hypothetical protein
MRRNGYMCKINSGYHTSDPDEKKIIAIMILVENLIRINQTLIEKILPDLGFFEFPTVPQPAQPASKAY